MSDYIQIAERELSQVEELLDVEFCDDGLVFYHLQNSVIALLKALAEEYRISVEAAAGISDLLQLLSEKTTIRFPEWVDQLIELEELSFSDGCGTSICYDMDMYGDILDAVYQLREFVKEQVKQ
ncbi:HEPN domain-containing protein [Persephonella sp.]|nr:HEPN domain-containing protein [Aquificota bacterium]